MAASELYAVTGIAHLPFNTIFQVAAAAGTSALASARTLLLIPDLLAYWLTGVAGAEVTNASTTALLDVGSRTWAAGLMNHVGIPRELFPALRRPEDVIGPVNDPFGGKGGRLAGADGEALALIAVASHDTASAVVAVPAEGRHFAYISSGTWSLVGMELDRPVVTEASRAANFTNEAGVDLDSLAVAYRRALTDAQLLSGRHADAVHVVGGGSRNELLCQLTADATGLPVVAGPSEATALGNVLVQGRAAGAAPGTLPEMRALLRGCVEPRRFTPSGNSRAWEDAAARQGRT